MVKIQKLHLLLGVCLIAGLGFRFYDLHAPWKRKDHYNYGGLHTTMFVECYKKTPLSVSKAIPHMDCADNAAPGGFYPNHPPTLIIAEAWWTDLWGLSEASIRTFVAMFSLLNVLLVYLLARAVLKNETSALLAATVQAVLPATLYFGTHADFICEFAVFFSLLATLLMKQGRAHLAGFVTVLAGLVSWPGFLGFAGLAFYTWRKKRSWWPILIWGAFGFTSGLILMMWLQQKLDLIEFLKFKLVRPGYVGQHTFDYLYPLRWTYQAWQYLSMLISPLFALWAVLALTAVRVSPDRRAFGDDLILISGSGILYAIAGHEYFYIHAFLWLYALPGVAILLAWWLTPALTAQQEQGTHSKWGVSLLTLFVVATYSYGRLKTNLYLDSINDAIMAFSVIGFAILWLQKKTNPRSWLVLFVLTAMVNFSQLVNWRNEPETDMQFCNSAREEFARTHSAVTTNLTDDLAMRFYCRGIPVQPQPEQ